MDDQAGWLFLMQHYRLPTRLLDWSESPLVALYFAVCDRSNDRIPGALWAIDPHQMNRWEFGVEGIVTSNQPYAADLFRKAFTTGEPDTDAIAAVMAPEVDLRMLLQQSGMTIHGNCVPLEERPLLKDCVLKFSIPSDAKESLRHQLMRLGFTAKALFPDLEHLAEDLSTEFFI